MYIWYCFAQILQADFDIVKQHWNSHRIRKSIFNTVSGRPDSPFLLPEHHGTIGNLLLRVSQPEIDYTAEHIVQSNDFDEYEDYFNYARNALGLDMPHDWQEADSLYRRLLTVAQNGEE